jgi:hypothetical protein
MFTAWVTLTTGQRPRRTHRMHIDGTTVCGIRTRYRIRFVKRWEQRILPHPRFCHVCFKYKYRFWSQNGYG